MPRVIVVGGSLGGLTAALVLRDTGCDVRVFERSSSALQARGAGIAALDATLRYLIGRAGCGPAAGSRHVHGGRGAAAGGALPHAAHAGPGPGEALAAMAPRGAALGEELRGRDDRIRAAAGDGDPVAERERLAAERVSLEQ